MWCRSFWNGVDFLSHACFLIFRKPSDLSTGYPRTGGPFIPATIGDASFTQGRALLGFTLFADGRLLFRASYDGTEIIPGLEVPENALASPGELARFLLPHINSGLDVYGLWDVDIAKGRAPFWRRMAEKCLPDFLLDRMPSWRSGLPFLVRADRFGAIGTYNVFDDPIRFRS